MALSPTDAADQVRILKDIHVAERTQLDTIRRYWKGRQALPAVIPISAPREVKTMARIARVNICPIVIDSLAQATFVDGFRIARTNEDTAVWNVWQVNKMDARQTGVHRAAFAYGAAYTVVLPGDPVPVIRTASPRTMCAVYGEDPDWPMWALERLGRAPDGSRLWKLYDDTNVYYVSETQKASGDEFNPTVETRYGFVSTEAHNAGVVPVIRYLDEEDLDSEDEVDSAVATDAAGPEAPTRGQIAQLMHLQDQIDVTTFLLKTAEWYAGFRQRWITGWLAESEQQRMHAGASQLWTFEDEDGNVKIGEFGQTDLDGYIKSRESSLRHAATLSQTPVHELLGELVNLSAEALAAAESGHERKVDERKTLLGESHEQTLRLVGRLMGETIPENAEVIWRDTSARTFAATVDGLGKLAQMLKIPVQELWERVPGATQQDVERWKAAAQSGDAFDQLATLLGRQNTPTA